MLMVEYGAAKRSFLLLCLTTFVLFAGAGAEAAPRVTALSAVLMDSATGEILWEKNPDLRRPPASTTKIMTAVVALEKGNLNKKTSISTNAAGTEGSSIWLQEGEKLSRRELLYGALLNSGNDACIALAEAVSGSVDSFVVEMNRKAKEMGADGTHFANPNGLPDKEHYTTARDLATITRYGMKMPRFKAMVKTKELEITATPKGVNRYLRNHNKLLWNYDGADGVKTGYTMEAGKCLVASATRNGQQLIAVVLASRDIWSDTKNMLEYGFTNYILVRGGTKGEIAKTIRTVEGSDGTPLKIALADDLAAVVRTDSTTKIDKVIKIAKGKTAPIKKGEKLGSVELRGQDGRLYGKVSLVAARPVPKATLKKTMWSWLVAAVRWLS